MKCTYCDTEIKAGAKFCEGCGAPIDSTALKEEQIKSGMNEVGDEAKSIWNKFLPLFKAYVLQALNFKDRTGRLEYWVPILVVSVVLTIFGSINNAFFRTVEYILSLACILPSIAAGTRRLHDTNRSGWYQLLDLIPVVGWIIVIVFMVQQPVNDGNKYGTIKV